MQLLAKFEQTTMKRLEAFRSYWHKDTHTNETESIGPTRGTKNASQYIEGVDKQIRWLGMSGKDTALENILHSRVAQVLAQFSSM